MPKETNQILPLTSDISSHLKISNEFLGVLVGIVTSIITILSQIDKTKMYFSPQGVLIFVDFLNLVVLLLALRSIKATQLSIEGEEIKKVELHLNIRRDNSSVAVLLRTNQLIKQLVHSIRWFIIILGTFYLLQFIIDIQSAIDYNQIKSVLDEKYSMLQLFEVRGGVMDDNFLTSAKYLTVEMLTNAANLFSASFLFLAFQVLFLKTLENDNQTWSLKGYVPFSIAIFITMLNVLWIVTGVGNLNLSTISHIIRLTGGIYNGVAMLLLFSRFISMEYFFQNSKKKWEKDFYFYGTVIGLPLYVVAQPLYGLFNAVEVGSAVIFKAVVFLVCFWGKLVFFLFVFTMLKKRWIHTYVFMVLTQKDTLSNLSKDVGEIYDL